MKFINKLAIATATTAFIAPMAMAQTATNTLTNIVTIVDSCDIVAIGVDFGVQPGSISSDITSVNANTTAGNTITGNAGHPDAAKDGGAANDDELSLTTPVAALNTAIGLALSTVASTAPGVYVVCTTVPTGLVVTGGSTDAVLDLTTAGAVTPVVYEGTLDANGGGAAGSIAYTLSFTGVVVSPPAVPGVPGVFTGVYTAMGTIPAAGNEDTKLAGFYSEVATATLTF